MTDVVVFHHAQGLTPGVRSFADSLRAGGHEVTTPDLYDARTFDTLEAGVAYAQEIGFGTIAERGRLAAESLPAASIYAGFSLGVMSAQMLAQTRPGAKGALLYYACLPISEFGGVWPKGVPVEIHAMADDPYFRPKVTSMRRASWSKRPTTPSSSCIRATRTCSRTTAFRRTTMRRRRYFSNARSRFSTSPSDYRVGPRRKLIP